MKPTATQFKIAEQLGICIKGLTCSEAWAFIEQVETAS